MGTRNTDMGKNRVLLSRMSILPGKTHTNQAQQKNVASAPHRGGETTDSAVVVGGPGRPQRGADTCAALRRLNLVDS